MKLSDFSQKAPVRKRANAVFNLNNDQRESDLKKEIADLHAKLKAVNDQLPGLKERSIWLDNKEAIIVRLNSRIEGLEKEITRQEGLVNIATEHSKEFDYISEDRNKIQAELNRMEAEVANKNKEINTLSDELNNKYNQYTATSTELSNLSDQFSSVSTLLEESLTEIDRLTQANTDLENSQANLSKIYIENETELKQLKMQHQFVLNDNIAAREKIGQTEAVKDRLEGWMRTLRKESDDSQTKLSAFEETVQKSKTVMLDMSSQINTLMEDREKLIDRVHYLTKELMKPRMMNETSMLRAARLPTGQEAVHRQYLGHGKPRLLKFKLKEDQDDDNGSV